MIRFSAARTSCQFDNLRNSMRHLYYKLVAADLQPTHILAGRDVLAGYEMLSEQNDPPITTFKGLPVRFSPHVAGDVMEFYCGREQVGELWGIS
jgi:hypothetical protein